MSNIKLTDNQILEIYEKTLAGKTLEIISKELNITLDILKDWKKMNYDEIDLEINRIREEGKKRRLKSEETLDQIEEDLNRIEIHKVKK